MKFRSYAHPMNMKVIRSVVASLALLLGLVVMTGGKAFADETIGVSEAQVGATNPGYKTGSCGDNPADAYVWHFILNGLDTNTTAGTITVQFENAGTKTASGEPAGNGSTQHFWVYTSGPDTLLGAQATVTDQSGSPSLLLSHVCIVGQESTSTQSTETNTGGQTAETLSQTSQATSQAETATTSGGGGGGIATSVRGSTSSSQDLATTGARETFYLAVGVWMLIAGAVLGTATNRSAPAEVRPSESRS